MYLTDKATLLGGIITILLAICLVGTVVSNASIGDVDPFEDAEVGEFLETVHDNREAVFAAAAFGIVTDGFVALAFGGLMYVLFRDRSRLLATLTLMGIVTASAVALVVDGSNILLAIIAEDYVEGGQGGLAAADPSVLEVGRIIGILTYVFTNVGFTPLGLALTSLGMIIALAPAGAINPPRWMGWVAIVSGLSAWLSWSIVLSDAGFVFFAGNGLTTLILLVALGIWLFMHRDLQPAA